jgi:hypothetical protein
MQPSLPNATTKAMNAMANSHGLPATSSKIPAPKIEAMIK